MKRLAPLLVLTAAACTGPAVDAPSLARRPAEGRGFAEPVRPEAVATPDAALDVRIAERVAAYDAALARYAADAVQLRARIAAGSRAAEGSDAWIAGQAATGELGQARAAIDAALANVEELALLRAKDNLPPYPRLEQALADATAKRDALAR